MLLCTWSFGAVVVAVSLALPAATAQEGSAEEASASLSVGALSAQTASCIRPDGTVDRDALIRLMRSLRSQIDSTLALSQGRAADSVEPAPLSWSQPGWRLWAFWSMDIPACAGLASALVQVRASGLALVHPVHLAGLRAWEAWLFEQNDRREQLVAAARSGDQQRCQELSAAWRDEVEVLRSMAETFSRGGVRAVTDTATASVLRVHSCPCFRLVSPARRVHALDGFGPAVDLTCWVKNCQAWEARMARSGAPPPGAPAQEAGGAAAADAPGR